jgi:hypothetical protein
MLAAWSLVAREPVWLGRARRLPVRPRALGTCPALWLSRGGKENRGKERWEKEGSSHGKNNVSAATSLNKDPLSVFKPILVKPNPDDLNFGEEIAGKINKQALLKELNRFYTSSEIKTLCKEHGLDDYLYGQAYSSFRRFCMNVDMLPTELYILFSDILAGANHNHDIFPYFFAHAKKVFPHLDCLEDLRLISDLTDPPNWYPEARALNRRIIFHAGPTNSGKTYHALERFSAAKSGVYCGPLKMLAVEVQSSAVQYNSLVCRCMPR